MLKAQFSILEEVQTSIEGIRECCEKLVGVLERVKESFEGVEQEKVEVEEMEKALWLSSREELRDSEREWVLDQFCSGKGEV